MALPSFQSVFVPSLERCNEAVHYEDTVAANAAAFLSPRGGGDPDSDFEYDLYSDCSSNRE